jgi:hypothetical protein
MPAENRDRGFWTFMCSCLSFITMIGAGMAYDHGRGGMTASLVFITLVLLAIAVAAYFHDFHRRL